MLCNVSPNVSGEVFGTIADNDIFCHIEDGKGKK